MCSMLLKAFFYARPEFCDAFRAQCRSKKVEFRFFLPGFRIRMRIRVKTWIRIRINVKIRKL
jgi:hypothetical protein